MLEPGRNEYVLNTVTQIHACETQSQITNKFVKTQHIHMYDDLVKGVLGTGPRPGIGHPERRELQDASAFCKTEYG